MSDPVANLVQIVTTTTTLEEARRLAQTLLAEYRAACIQIDGPIESHYRWQGNLELANEYRLTVKTTQEQAAATMRAIRELHSYAVPELLVLPILSASASYADWVHEQLLPPTKSFPNFAVYLYGPEWGPLPLTFEQVADRLRECDRLFFEEDGSFVWTGEQRVPERSPERSPEKGQRWQVDGMVYDAAGQVQYIDLKGTCPLAPWKQLTRLFATQDSRQDSSDAPSPLTVLVLPGQQRKSLEQFTQETWKHTE